MARSSTTSRGLKVGGLAAAGCAGVLLSLGLGAFRPLEDDLIGIAVGRALADARANDAWLSPAVRKASATGDNGVRAVPAVVRPLAIGDRLQLGTHGEPPRPFRVTEIREIAPLAAGIESKAAGARLVMLTCLPVEGAGDTPVRLLIELPAGGSASLPQSL